MKNVIAIIKNAWGDSPPPKVKTGFILNIIGLTAFLCLSGATAHAQSDKQIINMDNPDYHIDVERFCSPFIDFDNPEEYNSKEVNYRYVKYTQNMNKNEMPEAAIRSPRDSTCLVFITIPNTKAGSSTSI